MTERTCPSLGTVPLDEQFAHFCRCTHFHVAILAVLACTCSAKEHLAVRNFVLHVKHGSIHKASQHHTISKHQPTHPTLSAEASKRLQCKQSSNSLVSYTTSSCWCDSKHLGSLHSFFRNFRHITTRRLSWMNLHAFLFLQKPVAHRSARLAITSADALF